MRVVGVDPGSKSFDIFGYELENKEEHDFSKRKIIIEKSIPTIEIGNNPEIVVNLLKEIDPIDLIIAPSGFGLPIKKIQELTDDDIFQLTLRKKNSSPSMGLGNLLEIMKNTSLNAIVIPSIKHLPTVHYSNKINKIDLGTTDKLCAAVFAIYYENIVQNIDLKQINIILVEIGDSFTSIIAIKEGKIVDGIGGTNIIGWKNGGFIDGELAYLINNIKKKTIYSGGIKSLTKSGEKKANSNSYNSNPNNQNTVEIYCEILIKNIYSLLPNFRKKQKKSESFEEYEQHEQLEDPETLEQHEGFCLKKILISGRRTKNNALMERLQKELKHIASIETIDPWAKSVKRAAQGAAMIADGLLGGPMKHIINNLEIKKAQGHILDYIYFDSDEINELKNE